MDEMPCVMWDKEEITDHCEVIIRVASSFVSKKDDKPQAAAFLNTPKHGPNLSCDWCKYSSVKIAKEIVSRQIKFNGDFKDPNNFRFWNMNVGKIRKEVKPTQIVLHDPLYNDPEILGEPNNRAHSIIEGEKSENNVEFRVLMVQIGNWA